MQGCKYKVRFATEMSLSDAVSSVTPLVDKSPIAIVKDAYIVADYMMEAREAKNDS